MYVELKIETLFEAQYLWPAINNLVAFLSGSFPSSRDYHSSFRCLTYCMMNQPGTLSESIEELTFSQRTNIFLRTFCFFNSRISDVDLDVLRSRSLRYEPGFGLSDSQDISACSMQSELHLLSDDE